MSELPTNLTAITVLWASLVYLEQKQEVRRLAEAGMVVIPAVAFAGVLLRVFVGVEP